MKPVRVFKISLSSVVNPRAKFATCVVAKPPTREQLLELVNNHIKELENVCTEDRLDDDLHGDEITNAKVFKEILSFSETDKLQESFELLAYGRTTLTVSAARVCIGRIVIELEDGWLND